MEKPPFAITHKITNLVAEIAAALSELPELCEMFNIS